MFSINQAHFLYSYFKFKMVLNICLQNTFIILSSHCSYIGNTLLNEILDLTSWSITQLTCKQLLVTFWKLGRKLLRDCMEFTKFMETTAGMIYLILPRCFELVQKESDISISFIKYLFFVIINCFERISSVFFVNRL